MVSPLTFHQPGVLARQATAVDILSGGRLIFGIGAGWNEHEHQVFNVPFMTVGQRIGRLEEGVKTIREAWKVSHPKPVRDGQIPILMGGVGEKRHLPLVAREAAEWNYTRMDRDEYRQKRKVIDESCKEIGRDPSSIRYSLMASYIVGRDRDELRERALKMASVVPGFKRNTPDEILKDAREDGFVGTPEEVTEQIREYAKLGIELVMLQHFLLDDRDSLELLAKEVIPAIA